MKEHRSPSLLRAVTGILAAVFVADTAIILATSRFNAGAAIMVFFSILLTLSFLFYYRIRELTRKGPARVLKTVFLALLAAYVALIAGIVAAGRTSVTYDEDVVIVLGCGVNSDGTPSDQLARRLDGCIDYCARNEKALIVVTGGMSRTAGITEASSMKNYLVRHGIPAEKILEEGKARSTGANFTRTKALLEENGIEYPDGIAFITSRYHVLRSSKSAARAGFTDIGRMGTPAGAVTFLPSVFRESVLVMKMLLGI